MWCANLAQWPHAKLRHSTVPAWEAGADYGRGDGCHAGRWPRAHCHGRSAGRGADAPDIAAIAAGTPVLAGQAGGVAGGESAHPTALGGGQAQAVRDGAAGGATGRAVLLPARRFPDGASAKRAECVATGREGQGGADAAAA